MRTGQFERTLLEAFCAAANIKAFLKRDDCPKVLKDCESIVEACYGGNQRGTLMTDIRTLGHAMLDVTPETSLDPVDLKKATALEDELYDILQAKQASLLDDVPGWTLSSHAIQHDRYIIRGAQYSTSNTTERNSVVFFDRLPRGPFVPGIIRRIFTTTGYRNGIERQFLFLAIQRYALLDNPGEDPFVAYPDFGANLWSKVLVEGLDVVPASNRICHAIRMEWNTSSYALKPLAMVSNCTFAKAMNSLTRNLMQEC